MGKIGFFGGSFNPPTKAHINLSQQIVEICNLDKLIFVPIGDFYEKTGLIEFKHRYNMLKIMCDMYEKFEVSDIERNQQTKLYAIDIFEIIKKQYQNDDIYYIMGSDNLEKINSWKDYNDLIRKYRYIILERKPNAFRNIIKDNLELNANKENFNVISNYKYVDISSSLVREKIKKNEDISNLVVKEIKKYIEINHLYKI